MMMMTSIYTCSSPFRRGGAAAAAALLLVALVLLVGTSSAAASTHPHNKNDKNNNEDDDLLLAQFGDQLRCPYAEKWLTKGPKQAAIDLGLNAELQEHLDSVMMEKNTKNDNSNNNIRGNRKLQGGPPPGVIGGSTPTDGETTTCAIAVGPAGAAHQASYATGYRSDCPGTPAESSPYQWPLQWTAQVHSQSMPYGSDTVIFESKSRVFYSLNKNYKRSDTYYTRGVQRSIGQSPCPEGMRVDDDPSNALLACRRDSDQRRTMLHRGSKMYFINWKQATSNESTSIAMDDIDVSQDDVSQIQDCTWLDLAIVGNVRPDWFLDDRGDDTDVQYLGNQHVYTNTAVPPGSPTMIPRLVKQWRKKDFANQYFTMSMLANPYNETTVNSTEQGDGIHWPVILNVPGEGFGDDFLQSYSNHRLLTDDEDDLFLLDQAFVASGGECPERIREGGGPPPGVEGGGSEGSGEAGGPPPSDVVAGGGANTNSTTGGGGAPPPDTTFGPPQFDTHIPSNLEVDDRAWFTNVYTYSPVWEAPPKSDGSSGSNMPTDPTTSSMATTTAGLATISSCYDEGKNAVYLKFAFDGVMDELQPLPWMALAYRQEETCRMNPVDGTDGEMILLSHNDTTNESTVSFGSLPAALRASSPDAVSAVYDSMVPLDQVPNGRYTEVHVHVQDDDDNTAAIAPMSTTHTAGSSSSSSSSSTSQVELEFYETMPQGKPTVLYMNYAIGMSPVLGYHKNRLCFEIVDFPTCSVETAKSEGDETDKAAGDDADGMNSSSAAAGLSWTTTALASSLLSLSALAAALAML